MNQLQALITFLLVVLAVTGLLHWFLYARLVIALGITSAGVLWSLRLTAAFLAVSYLLAHWVGTFAPDRFVVTFHWFASVWLGLMFQLLWITLDLWIIKLLLRLAGLWGELSHYHAALGKFSVIGVVVLSVALCIWAMVMAQRPARIAQVRVPVKEINSKLRQMKIVMVADFHAGVLVGRKQLDRWINEINRLEPDVILIPGDILDVPPKRAQRLADSFRKLKAPMGVYASTGNHEYYTGLEKTVKFLEAAGMRVLMNECVELPGGLIIAAVEDRTAHQWKRPIPPVEELLGEEAENRPVILLNHTPSTRDAMRTMKAGADLMVSGHTHGGQMWPFSIFTRWVFPFHHGLYPVGDGFQLTTSGIGYWGPPMRLGCPPEIMLIRLVAEDEPANIAWK